MLLLFFALKKKKVTSFKFDLKILLCQVTLTVNLSFFFLAIESSSSFLDFYFYIQSALLFFIDETILLASWKIYIINDALNNERFKNALRWSALIILMKRVFLYQSTLFCLFTFQSSVARLFII